MADHLDRARRYVAASGIDALLVTKAENRRHVTGFTGSAGLALVSADAALLADAEQGPHQVLPVPHPPGDPVEGDVDDLARHGSNLRLDVTLPSGKCFPRLGWPGYRVKRPSR